MNDLVPYNSNQKMEAIAKGIAIIDNEINKKYMFSIVDGCKAVPIDTQTAIKLRRKIKLRKIDKVVLAKGEDINQKLTGVYNSLHHFGATLLIYLHGTKSGVEMYFGVRGTEGTDASIAIEMLEKSLEGNFPGSKIETVDDNEKLAFLEENIPIEEAVKTISAVYAVPSLQNLDGENEDEGYVQGIEKFIDTMAGEEYTAMFVCEPINRSRLQKYRRDLEQFYTDLSMIDQFELTYGSNESRAFAETIGANMSKTIGSSTSVARSHGESHSKGGGTSSSRGGNVLGFNWSNTESANWNDTWNSSHTETDTNQESRTDGMNVANSITDTTGTSQSYSSTVEIKPIIEYMKRIEGLLERIEKAESYGMWETAGYFISSDSKVSRIGAAVFKSLISGENSHLEPSFTNVWDWGLADCDKQIQISTILKHLHCGNHPVFRENSENSYGQDEFSFIRASNLVSGSELPIFVGLPRKSVAGITALTYAEFGRNVHVKETKAGKTDKNKASKEKQDATRIEIDIGAIYHMGERFLNSRVKLNLNSLSSHCFIAGSTGSGKSTTIYKIIDEAISRAQKVNFLVIEPVKGEYKKEFGNMPGIRIFTTNPKFNEMLRLNPFAFHENIHVLEHLDRLIEIFSACWPLEAAMPAFLKKAFERAYIRHGWDLNHSIHIDRENGKFPTCRDVAEIMPDLLAESAYSAEVKGNYVGALVTRVESLANGLLGQIFTDDAIPDEVLFDENVIVDISRIGSSETKGLLMGILILKLSEYRQALAEGNESNKALRHITILEEAHNILKRTTTAQNQESANVQGKSVEMISNAIAEMRTYGEGFIIADQSPTSVDISAIKNTNTKIIMRLPELSDCELAGRSIGLNDEQITELSRLNDWVAVVFQNNWEEAVLAQIDKNSEQYKGRKTAAHNRDKQKELLGKLIPILLPQSKNSKLDIGRFGVEIERAELSHTEKMRIRGLVEGYSEKGDQETKSLAFAKLISQLLNCNDMFRVFDDMLPIADMTDTIDQTTYQACRSWLDRIYYGLDNYADLPKDCKGGVMSNLVTYKYVALKDQRYRLVWFVLNKKVRVLPQREETEVAQ